MCSGPWQTEILVVAVVHFVQHIQKLLGGTELALVGLASPSGHLGLADGLGGSDSIVIQIFLQHFRILLIFNFASQIELRTLFYAVRPKLIFTQKKDAHHAAGALFGLSGCRRWSFFRGRENRPAELVLDSLLGILEVLIQLVDVYNWILGILVSILTISIVDTLLDLRSKDAGKLGHKVSSIAPHDRAEDWNQYKETGQNQSNTGQAKED